MEGGEKLKNKKKKGREKYPLKQHVQGVLNKKKTVSEVKIKIGKGGEKGSSKKMPLKIKMEFWGVKVGGKKGSQGFTKGI